MFLGGAAPIVFYSMATSSAEDVPRSLQFLFSRNRLNVVVSRAMCLAVVVASPLLLESRARTIEQMRLINADIAWVPVAAVRSGEAMKRQRLEIAIHREVASRLKLAAARRDLTVRQYVLHAVKDRIHEDLGGADTSCMTPITDPVLADLWNNRRDAAYDRL